MSSSYFKNGQLTKIAGRVSVDPILDVTSENAIQNKVVAQKIGTTDISSIGDGTITGAVSSLNNDLTVYYDSTDGKFYQLVNGQKGSEISVGKQKNFTIIAGGSSQSGGVEQILDISDFNDSDTVCLGMCNPNTSLSVQTTISTLKTYTTAHEYVCVNSGFVLLVRYSNGKLYFKPKNDSTYLMVTFNVV